MNQNNLIAAALFTPKSLQFPNLWVGHLPFAAWVIQDISPTIFVKLGTHSGNSYFSFCQAVVETGIFSKCYAVDTWEGDEHAGQYSDEIFAQVNAYHLEHYAEFSRLLRMTFDDAVTCFADESIELLHIDGLHTYEAVHHDFETWLPKLAPGAVVMFHDTNVRERNFGVWKLWEELQTRYPNNLEFVHSHGLGVLQLNNASDEKRLEWLQPDSPEKQGLINYFAALGSRQLERIELNELKLHAANLNQTLIERDGQINAYRLQAEQFDDQLRAANKQIASLNQTVVERDRHIAELRSEIVSREERALEQDEQLKIAQALYAQMASSTSWRISLPLREAKRFLILSPEQQAKRYIRGSLRLARRMYQALPLSSQTKEAHRNALAKYLPRLLLVSGSHPATIPDSAASKKHHQLQKHALQQSISASCIKLDKQYRYCLSEGPGDYTYIPKHRPDDINRIVEEMDQQPIFSIIVPVYNTPTELLTKALDSVRSQWYPHWELILADDASPSVQTKEELAKINDPRIVVLGLPNNQGIAGATNAALARATGEFIVLLDHDDELTDDCLFELALCINRENPDYIYSDEDKINPDGCFTEPHFKPDWSPDTMMSTMYVCHVSCIRRSLLDEVGGLRSDYDGCQDWDLVLRLVEKTRRISHIPKILYHWRIIPASTAADIAAKPYVLDASRRVREDALKRRGLTGTVEPVEQVKGYFRVNYHSQGVPLISIIIPSRDNAEMLRRCLNSIIDQSSYQNFELVVLDNGSVAPATLDYLDQIRTQANTTVIRHEAPFNFSELNNIGVNKARGDILLFLNDDTEVMSADWLERMAGYAQLAHVGAVGAKLLYPDGYGIQHAGVLNIENGPVHAFLRQEADAPGYYMRNLLEYNWLAVTGACLMVERAKFQRVGGFDETFPIAYNDIDLCLRLHNSGLHNIVCQAVMLIHHESVSRGRDDLCAVKSARAQQEMRHLFDKNPRYFQYDPYHNPNLHPNGINFELMR